MAQGTKANGGPFFEDVLRVRYSGPDLPSLTIVDLPGIIETQLEGGSGAERVVDLVTSYMRDDKSIILAVVPANYDPEIQKVFKYLKAYDPSGSRTIGVITKPDMIERGGDNEKELMRLAKNEKYPLEHRWHAVKNRGFSTREQTDAERDDTESKFFASGMWSSFPQNDVGIAALRIKLSRVLLEHIGKELPTLVTAVQGAIGSAKLALESLGNSRETSNEQRSYLTRHAERFQLLTHDALRGIYSNSFFALSSHEDQTSTRLRTAVQNLNIAFAHTMYHKGHTWDIMRTPNTDASRPRLAPSCIQAVEEYEACFPDPEPIGRTEFLEDHIGKYVRQSRPAGLPSLVNPLVIGEVFREQSRGWCDQAQHHLERVFDAVMSYLEDAVGSLMDARTCNMLLLKHVRPEMDRRWHSVKVKLEELLVPYVEQDPITYDPGFLHELEAIRAARFVSSHNNQGPKSTPFTFGPSDVMGKQKQSSQHLLTESLDDYTNSEILDLMQTYYKVSLP